MAPSDIESRLVDHLKAVAAAPFLFVGSGLFRRYLGLPTWEGLLRQVAAPLPMPFDYYRRLQLAASLLAEDFHNLWWSEPRYEASRAAFGSSLRNRQSALKAEVAGCCCRPLGHGR